jgi:DNA repair protein RadC
MTILYVQDGNGFREAMPPEVFSRTRAMIAQRFRTGFTVLSRPSACRDYLHMLLAALDHEVFGVLHLDNRHRLIEREELFRGTIDGASVHPREVVKSAILHNSAAVIRRVRMRPSGRILP